MTSPTAGPDGGADRGVTRITRLRRAVVASLWAVVAASLLLTAVSFAMWRRDLRELRSMVATEIDESAAPAEIVSQTLDFMRNHVGYGRPDRYFLLPIFSFMRPTALQVIRHGGDCAYRTRAFIVLLRLHGIRARKLALYDGTDRPVHAVAEVSMPGGPYYFDLLYNFPHERTDGTPLTLAELADDRVLRASVERAVAAGHHEATTYPVEWYTFGDVRTLNWDKTLATRAAFRLLSATIGPARARGIPRPHLSEEPALMVIAIALVISAIAAAVLVVLQQNGVAVARVARTQHGRVEAPRASGLRPRLR